MVNKGGFHKEKGGQKTGEDHTRLAKQDKEFRCYLKTRPEDVLKQGSDTIWGTFKHTTRLLGGKYNCWIKGGPEVSKDLAGVRSRQGMMVVQARENSGEEWIWEMY